MTNNKFGIILTTFNRYEYLEKTLETLSKTNFLPNTIIKIFDDCSTENKVIELLNNYFKPWTLKKKRNSH
jgi:glycosyltransferase involved in cell wall biosynthesis